MQGAKSFAHRRSTDEAPCPQQVIVSAVNLEGTADDASLDQVCVRLDREERFLHYHIRSSGGWPTLGRKK